MNKRQRKKYLKKKGIYVNPTECWNLDYTICEWILPRLKLFREETVGYPSIDRKIYAETGEMVEITFEDWQKILDEIILGFEQNLVDTSDYLIDDDLNFKLDLKNEADKKKYYDYCDERNKKIERGLDLFKYYFQDLWW